jgi:hypothetical protein
VHELLDFGIEELGGPLHLRAFSEDKRIYVDAPIADSAFDLRVAEQNLRGAQIA